MAGMKLNLNRSLSLIGMVVLCVGIAMSSVSATNTQNSDLEIQTAQNRQLCAQEISSRQECCAATTVETSAKKMRPIKLAGNQAACQWNYNQCLHDQLQ